MTSTNYELPEHVETQSSMPTHEQWELTTKNDDRITWTHPQSGATVTLVQRRSMTGDLPYRVELINSDSNGREEKKPLDLLIG